MPGSEWDHNFSEDNGRTKVSITILNESLERMEKLLEGFRIGFTMTLTKLENLLSTLSKKNKRKVYNHNSTIKVMRTINPWINFNGNAEEAFTFYKSVFGGEFAKIIRFKELSSPEFPIAENDANKIMHIALPVGKHNMLIANDVPGFMGKVDENENRSKISVSAESREEADKIFDGLSAGGNVEGPIGDSPWGTYAGMFRDKHGIEWIVEFDPGYNG